MISTCVELEACGPKRKSNVDGVDGAGYLSCLRLRVGMVVGFGFASHIVDLMGARECKVCVSISLWM